MIRYLILLIIPMFYYSCNTERQAQNKLQKIERDYPQLFKSDTTVLIDIDTLLLPIKESRLDTVILANDTIYLENDRIELKLIRIYDTISIAAKCKSDTIPYYVTDSIKIIQKDIVTQTEYVKYIPFWYKVVKFLFFALILIFFYIWGTIYSNNRLY